MKPDIRIESSACLLGAAAVLLIPLRWLVAAVAAALVHECGHLLMLWLLDVPVTGVCVAFGGASIETAPMSNREELLSAMAGPAAGLLLLPLARWIPCTAICAAVQSLYNLLPMGQRDGGRVLRCILQRLTPRASGICIGVEFTLRGLTLVAAAAAMVYLRLGILPLVIVLYVCAKSVLRKFPCKSAL